MEARPVGRPRTSPPAVGYYDPDTVAARRAYMAAYKASHAESLKQYYKAWRAANPEKHRQYNREWTARDKARRALVEPSATPQPVEQEALPGLPEQPARPLFAPHPSAQE